MKSYFHLILKRSQGAIKVSFISILFGLLGPVPAGADDFLAGQPYFSLSGMVAGADGATIASASGTNNPAFNFPDPTLQTKIGFGVAGVYGWLFDTNWRAEIELGHRELALDQVGSPLGTSLNGDLSITTGFVNVLHDFRGESFITPYVGIGVGGAYHQFDVGAIGDGPPDFGVRDEFSIVYQAMLGLNFEVGEDVDIFTGYRFMGTIRPDYEAIKLERLDIHHFEMGVKFYVEDWFN